MIMKKEPALPESDNSLVAKRLRYIERQRALRASLPAPLEGRDDPPDLAIDATPRLRILPGLRLDTYVIQAGREFRILRTNAIGEMIMASPAIARGSVFIRTATKLYRIARPPA